MKITFLKAGVPLTKTFTKVNGVIEKSSYPSVYEVTSIEENVKDMKEFAKSLQAHAVQGHCLVKGNPTRQLTSESRAGTTDSQAETDWVIFDVDGLPNIKTPNEFMQHIRMEGVSYVVQYSASYGIINSDLRCHIFVKLDQPMSAPLIKQWMIQLNHETPVLSNAMTLTSTGNSISWALDISANQNDKLLYIAPPLLGKSIKDPMAKQQRIEYVAKSVATMKVSKTINGSQANRVLTEKRLGELRDVAGLPKRKNKYVMQGNTEILSKPDAGIVTGIKHERGYVYFNLNGGDSWGYFHPEDNPNYIHNFKGEPAYLTKELLPEYWSEITSKATRTSSTGETFIVFCDRSTSTYWRGTYNKGTNKLDINPAKNETIVRHFAKQYGMPLGDFIPEWDLVYDPNDIVRVDEVNKVVNSFEPTSYMLAAPKDVKTCPKTIYKVIHHALGSNEDVTNHFINWLAFIIQNRRMTGTAWVLSGTQGTGKGILMNNIVKPLIGEKSTVMRRAPEMNEPYNGWIAEALMVFVDEVEVGVFENAKGVMSNIKKYITDSPVSVRRMYQPAISVPNYSNWIFASNKADPVILDKNDRRHNIAQYQPNKLEISQAEIHEHIPKELQAFYNYLASYKVNTEAVRTPLETEERTNLMQVSEASIDTAVSALESGSMLFFIEQLPTEEDYKRNITQRNRVEDYTESLLRCVDDTNMLNGKCSISRDTLRTILDYVVGNIPESPNKFTSMMKHHRVHIQAVNLNGKTQRGIIVTWTDRADFAKYRNQLKSTNEAPKLKVVK